jgi:hypothetical protein
LRVRDGRARRLRLSVSERGARLTIPLHVSLQTADHFLQHHRQWLITQLEAHATPPPGSLLQPEHCASLPLRGREVPLRWISGRALRLTHDDGGLCFTLPPRASPTALRRVLRDFYEAEGRADVGRWLPAYLPALPRAPRRILFKRTTSLWGSLAPDGTLALDLALLLAPPAAFEYVLVHELCHLLHANHSQHFWAEVAARYPDWPTQRAFLRHEGRRLKARLHALLADG